MSRAHVQKTLAAFALSLLVLGAAACEPTANVRVYVNDGYRGGSTTFGGSAHGNWGTAGWGDKVSSIKNPSAYWVAFFEHDTFGGDAVCLGPGDSIYDLGDHNVDSLPSPFKSLEDKVSSHKVYTSKPRASKAGGPCDVFVGG